MDPLDFAAAYQVVVEEGEAGSSARSERVEVRTTRIVRLSAEHFAERARRLNLPPHVSTFTLPPTLIVKRVNYVAKRLPLSDSECD